MPSHGAPEHPSYYSEQPQGYGGPPPTPWYRKPVPLVLLGMLAAVILALVVYAIVKLTSGDSETPSEPTVTTVVETGPNGPQTVTRTVPPTSRTTSAPTTTSQPTTPSTSTSTVVTTSTSTATATVTVPETPIGPDGIPPIGPDGIPPIGPDGVPPTDSSGG